MVRRKSIVAAAVLLLISSNSAAPYAQTQSPITEMAERAMASVVVIEGTTGQGESSGSGFLISSDGTIVTCLHVIADLRSGSVRLSDGAVYDSFTVKAVDERRDLAIIQIAGFDLPYIELGNSNDLKSGAEVLVVGNSTEPDQVLTTGTIGAIRTLEGVGKVFQTDAAANSGNSGEPLLSMSGEVMGVVDFKLPGAGNPNVVIPINYARGMLARAQASMSLDEMRQSLGGAEEAVVQGSIAQEDKVEEEQFPRRWKSLLSGTTKLIVKDGEQLYVDTEMARMQRARGDSITAILELVGDKYVGISRALLTCKTGGRRGGGKLKQCPYALDIELEIMSPTRIEGRVLGFPDGTTFNCRKCAYAKKAKKIWVNFAWIPE